MLRATSYGAAAFLAAAILGPREWGIVASVTVVANLLTQLVASGAYADAFGDSSRLNDTRTPSEIVLLATLAATAAFATSLAILRGHLALSGVTGALTLFMTIGAARTKTLQAMALLKGVTWVAAMAIVGRPVVMLLLTPLLLVASAPGAEAWLTLLTVSSVVEIWFARRLGSAMGERSGRWPRWRSLDHNRITATLLFGFGTVGVMGIRTADQLMLAGFGEVVALGSYALAVRLVDFAVILVAALAQSRHAALRAAVQTRSNQVLRSALTSSVTGATVLIVPLSLAAVLLQSTSFLEQFSELATLSFLLALTLPARAVFLVAVFCLNLISPPSRRAAIMWSLATANVVANLIAIPRYGAAGAASATLATEVVLALITLVEVRRFMGKGGATSTAEVLNSRH